MRYRYVRTTPAMRNFPGDADTLETITLRPGLPVGRRALLGLTLGLATATYGPPARADMPRRGGKMIFGRYQDATYLDPIMAQANADIWLLSNLFDNLVELGSDAKVVLPGLATKWEISPDARTVTFVLREGVKFADGSLLTAEDIKFSLDRKSVV